MYRSVLLRVVMLLLAAAPTTSWSLRAQGAGAAQDPAAEDVGKRVDAAIADYEEAKKQRAEKQGGAADALCRRTLGWLGEIDHERVTDYLAKDLRANAKTVAGSWTLDAIAKVPRPDLAGLLRKTLARGDAHWTVRRGAVRALMALGDEHTDDLLARARNEKDANVRRGILQALVTADSERVMREIADLMGDGDHDQRLFVVTSTAAARGVDELDRARVRCVKEGNLLLSATAWRILAEQGHTRARRLTIDVLERVYDQPDARSAAELVRGLVAVDDPDFYPAILRFGAVRGGGVRNALRASAKRAAESQELLRFLIDEGVDAESAAHQVVAKVLLEHAPAAAIAPLVERVREQLRRNRKKVLDVAAGLHELLAKDPTWVQDLAELAGERDFESRLLGLSLLLEMGSPAAVPVAQKYVRDRAWQLRSVAYRYLARCRDVSSIPYLIDRYEREDGRLKHELETALFVHTGTRCWTRRDWQKWWRANKEGFTLPHPNTVKGGGSTSGGQTISYYDIPLVSDRIAFIIDHSGSMQAKVGTDRKRTRLDLAKQQLKQVVEALPKDHRVNLIPFASSVRSLWDEVERLTNSNREEFLEEVAEMKAGGGTNTYGALMRVFNDPDVDTVYLLTDGQPSGGELTDPDDIVDAIARENRTRQLVVHCIGVGLDSQLLKDLAALTGGEYKYVR